jgi:small-conductance mechanosensitive channel
LSQLRILATIRLTYDTPADKLREMPKLLENVVREHAQARFERCHLKTLGESSFQFELSYFVQQPSVNPMLDLQQAVNFRIIDELRRLGVEFAYPTQLVVFDRHRPALEK